MITCGPNTFNNVNDLINYHTKVFIFCSGSGNFKNLTSKFMSELCDINEKNYKVLIRDTEGYERIVLDTLRDLNHSNCTIYGLNGIEYNPRFWFDTDIFEVDYENNAMDKLNLYLCSISDFGLGFVTNESGYIYPKKIIEYYKTSNKPLILLKGNI